MTTKEIEAHNALDWEGWLRKYNITTKTKLKARLLSSVDGETFAVMLYDPYDRWIGTISALERPPRLHMFGIGEKGHLGRVEDEIEQKIKEIH